MSNDLGPRFPLYIPSKGRAQYMMTSRALTRMNVPHFVVVEPQQVQEYREAVERMKIKAMVLEMDLSYKDRYPLLDNFGLTKSTGPGPARNFIWDHSISSGYPFHWVMDDNISEFYRLNKNLKVPARSPAFWRAMEDFVLRYENIAMAGPNYESFIPRKVKHPPFITNTRIYSCNLIRNDVPFRWRGRYNEDTILSLDMLKGGWCTVQFNAFLQKKLATQVLKGGNTDEFYHKEGTVRKGQKYAENGTLAKSQMLADVYPEYAKVTWRIGRIHHYVDYRTFKSRKLIRRSDVEIKPGVNNYGMVYRDRSKETGASPK